jgi:DNA-binding NtrC family response regulator
MVAGVASVAELRERVRGWFRREPKVVVPRSILIVDGNATNRQSTARLVESLGYVPHQTTGVVGALRHLDDEDPDFVLLGFDLADGEALDAIAKVREIAPELPIVMLAADTWDTRVAEAMRRGAVAYLARPFGRDDLRELLGRR